MLTEALHLDQQLDRILVRKWGGAGQGGRSSPLGGGSGGGGGGGGSSSPKHGKNVVQGASKPPLLSPPPPSPAGSLVRMRSFSGSAGSLFRALTSPPPAGNPAAACRTAAGKP